MLQLILSLLLFFDFSWVNSQCSNIQSCHCKSERVKCENVSNFESTLYNLEQHFSGENVDTLIFKKSNIVSLPSKFLGTLSPDELYLINSSIHHIDKDAFEGQKKMVLLAVTSNRLEDVPVALQHVNGLRTLDLEGNFLLRITEGSLNYMTKLEVLSLTKNQITTIEKNAFPKNLIKLFLSDNSLLTFNESLHDLHHLKKLRATDNWLATIKGEFKGLVSLVELLMDYNHLSDISDSFSDLQSLKYLSLSHNRIRDVGKAFENLTSLEILNLDSNYITKLDWRSFKSLKNLTAFDIAGNFLKTICPLLKHMISLQHLYLSHLRLKSLDPDCFYNMSSLRSLTLAHNMLSDVQAVSQNNLPLLEFLELNDNRLTTFRDLNYAESLKYLDISYNNFTTFNSDHLSHNEKLQVLILRGNPWKCSETLFLSMKDMDKRGVYMIGRPRCWFVPARTRNSII